MRADYISRNVDFDDRKVPPSIFAWLDSQYGPHIADCFAYSLISQLQQFHSRFWDPDSEAVDTFTVSWKNQTCWWAPLLHLVCRAIWGCWRDCSRDPPGKVIAKKYSYTPRYLKAFTGSRGEPLT